MKLPSTPLKKWLKEQEASSSPEGLVERKILVDEEVFEQVVRLSRILNKGTKVLGGELIRYAMEHIDQGGVPDTAFQPNPPPIAKVDLAALFQMVMRARFKGDTSSARFRQLAFLQLIAAEAAEGRLPTATGLARLTGSHKAQMDTMAATMTERGVIVRTRMSKVDTYKPDGTGTRSAKVIVIRDDALEAFNEAHRKATGSPIDLTRPTATSKIPVSET